VNRDDQRVAHLLLLDRDSIVHDIEPPHCDQIGSALTGVEC
jgi:hypothetical protein